MCSFYLHNTIAGLMVRFFHVVYIVVTTCVLVGTSSVCFFNMFFLIMSCVAERVYVQRDYSALRNCAFP